MNADERLPRTAAARRWLEHLLAPALLVVATALLLIDPLPFADLREAVFDTYQRLHPRPRQPSPVRLVDVDDASLARVGQWPWPRDEMATLIETLDRWGARVIAFDLLFAEPDRSSPRRYLERYLSPSRWATVAPSVPDPDEVLAATIRRAPVVLGLALVDTPNAEPLASVGGRVAGALPLPTAFAGAITPLPVLAEAAAGVGALNVGLDRSGVIRRLPLVMRLGDAAVPSLVTETLRVAQRLGEINTDAGPLQTIARVTVGALAIPVDANGQMRLYFAPPDPATLVPAWRVLASEAQAEIGRNAIVLVGASASGLQDRHATPLGEATPGALIHFEALDQILAQAYLTRPEWAKGAELLLLLGLGGGLLFIVKRAGAAVGAGVGFGATVLAVLISYLAFVEARLLLDPVLPSLATFGVFVGASLARHLQTERQQRWIRRAFASYVAPGVVDQLVRRPGQLALGGERRELSCLFTDLEGFTTLVEEHEPGRTVPLLNAYLDGLMRVVFRFEGTVDKIIGDALHVLFGAPMAMADHCQRAVNCALALIAFADRFAESQRASGLPFGRTRIGIASGTAIVGNFGGALRFDYTAHGDVVNTASRLEGANKYLGTSILVSGATAAGCPGFHGRPAGDLLLKGKNRPVSVFEPLPPSADPALLNRYLAAYGRLAASDAATARTAFAALAAVAPGDALVRFHLQRLQRGEEGTIIRLADK